MTVNVKCNRPEVFTKPIEFTDTVTITGDFVPPLTPSLISVSEIELALIPVTNSVGDILGYLKVYPAEE